MKRLRVLPLAIVGFLTLVLPTGRAWAAVCFSGAGGDLPMELLPDARDNGPLLQRTPLILIHGLNSNYTAWNDFLGFFFGSSDLTSKYQPYLVRYDSDAVTCNGAAEGDLLERGGWLKEQVEWKYTSGVWPKGRKVIVLAHSMGGLIARGFMQQHWCGSEQCGALVDWLITLATPHHGSHLSNAPALASFLDVKGLKWDGYDGKDDQDNRSLKCLNSYGVNGYFVVPGDPHYPCPVDLTTPERSRKSFFQRVIAYAAVASRESDVYDALLRKGWNSLKSKAPNDGAVPVHSALLCLPDPTQASCAADAAHYPVADRQAVSGCDHSRLLKHVDHGGCYLGGRPFFDVLGTRLANLRQTTAPLTVTLEATADSGPVEFRPTLTANASGSSGTPTYYFWQHCVSEAATATACPGPLQSAFPQFTPSYPAEGSYKAKVVVQRGGQWAQAQRSISAYVRGSTCQDTYNNPTPASALYILPSRTYSAKICTTSEQDWYRITVPSAGDLRVTMAPPAATNFDASLLSGSQATVATSPSGAGAAEVIAYTAPGSGTYYVTVRGHNSANANATYSLSYTFSGSGGGGGGGGGTDQTPPTVSITGPTTSTTWQTSTTPLLISGVATDNVGLNFVRYTNETTTVWSRADGTNAWSASVPLVSGQNVIRVLAIDTTGNSSDDALTVTYTPETDGTKPELGFTSPANGETTASSSTNVAGWAHDPESGIQEVTWRNGDNEGTAAGTTSWFASSVPLLPGLNQIRVYARNGAGKRASKKISVTYDPPDATPPTVVQVSPCAGGCGGYPTVRNTVRFSGTASDNVEVMGVTWENRTTGKNGHAVGTTNWWFDIDIPLGQTILDVRAWDRSLQWSNTITTVINASSPTPSLQITFPANPTYTTTTSSINLLGTASAPLGLATIAWTNSRGGSGSMGGSGSFSIPVTPLQPGDNRITVTATDVEGHAKSAKVTVSYTRPNEGNLTWIPKLGLPGVNREPSAYAAIGSKVYVAGATGSMNLDAYDTTSDTWARLGSSPKVLQGATAIGGKLYALGQLGGETTWTLCIFDPSGSGSWSTEGTTVPVRQWPGVVTVGGRLLVLGGDPGAGRVDEYDPPTHTWRTRAPMPTPRSQFGAAVLGDKVYTVGGKLEAGLPTRVTETYDPATDAWSTLPTQVFSSPNRPLGRAQPAATTENGRIYVVGGLSGTDVAEAEEYIENAAWWRAVNAPVVHRNLGALVAVAGKLYLIGGRNSVSGATGAVEQATILPDPAPPVIDIEQPTTEGTWATSASTVTLAGRARDNVAVSSVSWANDRGGSGVVSLPASRADLGWSNVVVPLQPGDNRITVTAVDGDGNSSSEALTVNYSLPQAPQLTSFSINRGVDESPSRTVTLDSTALFAPQELLASERSDFAGAAWQAYAPAPRFLLSGGNGWKRVFLKVRNAAGESYTLSDEIYLNQTAAGVDSFERGANVPCSAGEYHHLALDSAGAVYVVCWYGPLSGNGYQLALHRSVDGGTTFAPPVPIPGSRNVTSGFDLLIDPADVVHVVWTDYNGTAEVYYSRSIDRGSTYTTPVRVRGGAYWGGYQLRSSGNPKVAASGTGLVYVGLQGATYDTGNNSIGSTLWMAKSTNGGLSFGPEFPLYPPAPDSGVEMTRLRVLGGEFAVLFWRSLDSHPSAYFLRGASGNLGNVPVKIAPTAGDYDAQDLAAAPAGSTLHAVLRDQSAGGGGASYAVRSLDSGATWGSRVSLDEGNGLIDHGRLEVDGRGALHYVARGSGADSVLYTSSTDGGSTFSLPTTVFEPVGSGFIQSAVDTPRLLLYVSTDLGGGLVAIARGSFAVDPGAPTLAITSPTPAPTFATGAMSLTLEGWANDNVSVTLVEWSNDRGGQGIAEGTSLWEATDVALQAGVNVITVTAVDSSGLTATDTITVTTNTSIPTISITSPTSGATYASASATVTLSGTASDGDGIDRVLWASNIGLAGAATGTTSWTAGPIPLQHGTNVLSVTAYDAAANRQSATLTVTYDAPDSVPPAIFIASPTPAPTYVTGAATVALAGTASDDRGVSSVTWASDRGPSGTASGTASWSIGAVPLGSGVNVLTVTARDAAGNAQSATLRVTRGLSLQFVSPLGGETWSPGSTQRISWTSSYLDPAGGIQLFYYSPGIGWQFIADLPSSASQYDWTVPTNGIEELEFFVGHYVTNDWETWDMTGTLLLTSAPPIVTGFSPPSGRVGTAISISGQHFAGVTSVRFNGAPGSFTVLSPTSIRATVPSSATSGPITVVTARATAASATSFGVMPPCAGNRFICEEFDGDLLDWSLEGAAVQGVDGRVSLTPADTYRWGTVFQNTPATVDRFTARFRVQISRPDSGWGADGMTFAVVEHGPRVLGDSGSNLGYGGLPGRSIAIELDTYPNDHLSETTFPHIGLNVDGEMLSVASAPLGAIRNQGPLDLRVVFDRGQVDVYLKGGAAYPSESLVLSARIPGWQPFEGYFGFTAATGGYADAHAVDSLAVDLSVPTPTVASDFSQDGKPDLLWHHQTSGDLYTWFLDGTVTTGGSYLTPKSFTDTRWQIRGLADFDGDGRVDILWHHQVTGDLYVWTMNGPVAIGGSYLTPKSFADTRWQIRGIVDLNHDGKADILWHHQATGDLYVWHLNGFVVTSGSYLTPKSFADTRWQIRGVVDLNKDGQPDLLWHHQGTGDLYVWFLDGLVVTSGSYLTPRSFSDTRWQIRRVMDLDRDGHPDVLWHHQATGDLYVWFLKGLSVSSGSYLTPRSFADTRWQITPR